MTMPLAKAGSRLSRPDYYSPYGNGLGVIPRRGWDNHTAGFLRNASTSPIYGLKSWAETAPLRLLDTLKDVHPLAQMALSNDIALAFGPDDTRIIAVENANDREGNPEGTGAIESLWNNLPTETGGYLGLCATIAEMFSTLGMATVEGVPAPGKGNGLSDIATFSPLSIRFRDLPGGGRIMEQQQQTAAGWVALPPETVMAMPWRGSRDNPYGRPRLGAFLSEGLADLSEQGALKDVLHAVAWPHLAFEFPLNETVKYAQENPSMLEGMAADGGNMTPLDYAHAIFGKFMSLIPTMKADDAFTLPSGAKATVVNAGAGLAGAVGAMEFRRLRICQSLDHLPSLLGITDGGTQAYSSTQWKQYASKLEALRGAVLAVMLWLSNLHLRLLGMNLVAKAITTPIQTSDRMNDATAAAQEFKNQCQQFVWGIISDADFAQSVSGSSVVDPAKLEAAYQREMTAKAVGTGQRDPVKENL